MKKIYVMLIAMMILALSSFGQVTVTATAGTPGPTPYTTLKGAFDAINLGTHQGDITISLSGNTTETASAALNSGAVAPAVYTSVNITATAPVTVTGNIVGAIIKLNGADNVTIDGRIGGTGRNITVSNSNTSAATAAIWLASVAAGNGCVNNVIRNLELTCGATQNTGTNSTFGIIMCGTTISTTANGTDNDNNTFTENRIIRSRYGIVTRGTNTNLNETVTVTNNIIGPTSFGADEIGKVGIFMQADNNATVSGNTVQFVGGLFANTTGGADRVGIGIGQESWSMTPGTLTSTNYTVTKNVIHDIIDERTFSAVGLLLGTTNGGSATNNLVANNFIYDVRSNGTSGDQTVGIGISGGHTDRVVYNSVYLAGDVDPSAGATASTNFGSGIRIANANGTTHLNLTLQNNSVYMDLSSSSTAANRYYAISGNSAAYLFGTGGENYNNYYINPANTQTQTGGLGSTSGSTLTTQFATLANWQTAYTATQDANSIQSNPLHISSTNLHLTPTSPNLNVGTTIAGITDDIDGDTRPQNASPEIGADELFVSSCSGTPNAGTITPANANGCVGSTYTMVATGVTSGIGISYQWKIATTTGGPYVNVTGGTGATTLSYTTDPLTAGIYYYVLETTCSNGGATNITNELTLTVNNLPTVTVTPTTATYCNPGGTPVALTASGADTYTWSPAAGLSATNIANPTASPTVTTIYTVTGTTTATGCFNTATTTITVNQAPVVASTTATPASVCSGGNSQLQVIASLPLSSYAFATGSGAAYETITTPNVLTTVDAGTVDDGSNQVSPAGFTFPYNGTNYTGFSANTNGWLKMSAGAPPSNIPSSLISLSQNGIYAFGRDANLNIANGGNLTHGAAAGGKYVFQFTNNSGGASGATSATAYLNAQIILWGSTSATPGRIEIIYGSSLGTPGSSGSIGIASSTGQYINAVTGNSTALTNATTYPASGTVYTFTPLTLTYAWTPAANLNDPTIANPLASNITANTVFNVVVSGNGCTNNGSVTVNVATYTGAPTTQPSTTAVNAGSINQQVLMIDLPQACVAEDLTQIDFTNASTAPADVANAKVYYTTTNTFATTTQFGTTVPAPGATFNVSGTQAMSTTTRNYFWLVFDVACNATNLNSIDAGVTNVVIGGNGFTPTPANPVGLRTINSLSSSISGIQPTTTSVQQGSFSQQVLRVDLPATACGNLTNIDFTNVSGTTSDVTAARVFYTNTTTFANTTQFGSNFANPGATFSVIGNQALSTTLPNYLWLVFDINCAATVGNAIDAGATSVTIGGSPTAIPAGFQNPAGTRLVVAAVVGDNITSAPTAVIGAGATNAYTVIGKSLEIGEPSPILNSNGGGGSGSSNYSWGSAAGATAWYKIVVPTTGEGSSGNLLITANTIAGSSSTDCQVALWEFPSMPSGCGLIPNFTGGRLLQANDDAFTGFAAAAGTLNSTIRCKVTPGNTYYIQVDGFSTATPNGNIFIEDLSFAPYTTANNGLGSYHNPTGVDMQFAAYEVNGTDGWTYYYNHNATVIGTATVPNIADDRVLMAKNWNANPNFIYRGTYLSGTEMVNHVKRSANSLTAPSTTGVLSSTDSIIVWSGRNNAAGASGNLKLTAPYVTGNAPWYMFNKFWNTIPKVQPTNPVGVRFFYSDADYNDVNAAAGGIMAQHSDLKFMKFTKSPTTHYSNTEVDPGGGQPAILVGTASNYIHGVTPSTINWTNTDAVEAGINQAEFNVTTFSGGGGGAALVNPLPIVVNYLRGTKQGAVHNLNWKVTCTSSPTATMILERSGNNRTYSAINNITADAVRCAQPFDYVDGSPLAGINYYRLKIIDAGGKVTYSNTIAMVNKLTGIDIIGLSPNPVNSNGLTTLSVASAQKGLLRIVVTDVTGRQLFTQTESIIAGSNQIPMNVSKLAAGSYQVTAITDDGTSTSVRFIKQ